MSQIVSAVIAAAVALVVVLLTRRSETLKHFQVLRTSAYTDFIRGVAGLAIVQRQYPGSEGEWMRDREILISVADAKARIAIYGSASIVRSLALFLREGPAIDSPERAKAFTEVCQ